MQLVIINISDHFTRTRVNDGAPADALIRVVGCLLGQQNGRDIHISNSFEVNVAPEDPRALDFGFLHKRLEQCEFCCCGPAAAPAGLPSRHLQHPTPP